MNPEFLDTIESLHDLFCNGLSPSHKTPRKPVKRLSLERSEINIIKEHVKDRNKETQDEAHRIHIIKKMNFQGAREKTEAKVP